MNCNEAEQLMNKYLRGEATAAEEQAVQAHLESCPACRKMLDDRLAETETKTLSGEIKAAFGRGLSEDKQRRILRWAKYKNRFSIALFLLLVFVVFQVAGTFASSLFLNAGGEESRLYRTQQTAAVLTELTFPNVTMVISPRPLPTMLSAAGWGHSSLEIKPYFVARGSYALQKQIGKDKYDVGRLQVNHLFSSVVTSWNWQNGAYDHYLCFFHPDQLEGLNVTDPERNRGEETWRALEVLPEGTVAELALSFRETHSTARVMSILADYDLNITWYAVSTGLEGEPRRGDRQAPLAAFAGAWGFPDLSRNMLGRNSETRLDDSALREQYFLDSLRFLVENEKLAQRIYRGDPQELRLSERHRFIQKKGVQVYGVVVTGPVKELLKLRELDMVHSPALGDVRLWNWFNRDFGGTMY